LFARLLEHDGTTLEQLYVGPGPRLLFFVAEALIEFEQQFGEWRFKHVQLVERVIGPATSGTGGTLGSRFLMSTIEQKFFPTLWAGRAAFFGKK
jgi:tryptophan 2,3-dioxygenase